MIDLHMHTKYSDGTDTVTELLKKAQERNLEVISITDHDCCSSYEEMESVNVAKYFKGKIIVGTEFKTTFLGRNIEILGYGFDYEKVNKFLKNFYSKDFIQQRTKILYQKFLDILDNIGLIYHLEPVETFESEFFERKIYDELIRHPENLEILKEDVFSSFSNFFRKGISNAKSALYLDTKSFKPSFQEITFLIHESGGLSFLAHPFQYKFSDTEEFLEQIYDGNDLDGIECFYTNFSIEQTEYLINFAKKRNLLISGGSDYHGTNKVNFDLGIGRGDLKINSNILSNWNINYFE